MKDYDVVFRSNSLKFLPGSVKYINWFKSLKGENTLRRHGDFINLISCLKKGM
jgi:hypothetical protein